MSQKGGGGTRLRYKDIYFGNISPFIWNNFKQKKFPNSYIGEPTGIWDLYIGTCLPVYLPKAWQIGLPRQRILLTHGHQKLFIIFGLLDPLFNEFHRFYGVHVGQVLAHDPHTLNGTFVQ